LGLRGNVQDYLRLSGKRVVDLDFLLVLVKLFFARCYDRGTTSEYRFKSAISLQRSRFDPIFQVEGEARTNHSFSQKTRLNVLTFGIKIRKYFSSVLPQCTRLTVRLTDGPSDGQTDERTDYSHR